MYKDLMEAEGEKNGMYGYRDTYYRANYDEGYGNRGYGARGGYERDYGRQYMEGGYGRSNYRGEDSRMRNHIDRISEGAETYEYGRDRYQHGGSESGMIEGLEKLMYALCTFV